MNIYFSDTRDGNLISSRLVIKSVDNNINQGVFYCNMFIVLNWCPISRQVRETSPIPLWKLFTCIGGNSYKFNSPLFCFIISFGMFSSFIHYYVIFSLTGLFILHVPIYLHIFRTIKFQRPSVLLLSEFNRRLVFVFIRYPICPGGLLH